MSKKPEKKAEVIEAPKSQIYTDLLTKKIPDLPIDLTQPLTEILKENNEFESLQAALASQCNRLEIDNSRL